MNIAATGRVPLARPAMPIDIAAPAYHSSALKMTRLARFLAGRARPVFLARADLELLLFVGIFSPCYILGPSKFILAGDVVAVTAAPKKSLTLDWRFGKFSKLLIFNEFL